MKNENKKVENNYTYNNDSGKTTKEQAKIGDLDCIKSPDDMPYSPHLPFALYILPTCCPHNLQSKANSERGSNYECRRPAWGLQKGATTKVLPASQTG